MARPAVAAELARGIGESSGDVVAGSLASVCSKSVRDWERCLWKRARIKEAIDRADRAIE